MTTDFKYLRFFDKSGSDLNFTYNLDGYWEGNVFINEVSIQLFESENIFILEEFKTSGGITKFGVPHFSNNIYQGTGNPMWEFKWEHDECTDIFLYDFNVINDKAEIIKPESINIEVDFDPNQSVDGLTGQVISDNITNSSLQVNIALSSEDEDIFERVLLINEIETGKLIAKIKFYGETISEDERLPENLYKLGMSVDKDEYNVFRDSDINEYLPDYELLNRKRVELLVEGRNLKPFISTYKGLINAIKFYGYDNIKVNEYWLNINQDSPNYGKYRTTEVIDVFDDTVDTNDNSISLPNKVFKKTSLFSLSYRLNELTGNLDEYDLPETEETSNFTIEEVLIKLYGLQKVLKRKWLSGNSRIVDITGVGDYFSKIEQNVFIQNNRIDKVKVGIDPSFNIYPNNKGFIQDLRQLSELDFPMFTPYLVNPDLRADSDIKASEIADVLAAYFTNYSPNLKTIKQLPDKPNIPVGYPIVLENTSFTTSWNDANVSWNELFSTGSLIFDFTPYNPGSGDRWVIKDNKSGEYVEYVSTASDTVEDIVNGLYSEIQNELSISDGRPWSYYDITTESRNSNNDTIRFRQIFSAILNVDFNSFVEDNNSMQEPEFLRVLNTGNSLNTWDTYGISNFYEIEWRIYRTNVNDGRNYDKSFRGDIGDLNKLAIALPYDGTYTVELKLYDTFNQVSQEIKEDYIHVENKNVEFIGFYKAMDKNYPWYNNNTMWNDYGSYWDLPIIPEALTWEGQASLYESLNRANYILNEGTEDIELSYHYQNPDNYVTNNTYSKGSYFWNNLENSKWNDIYHMWWDSTKVSGDTPSNFRIYSVDFNESIAIEQAEPFLTIGEHIFETDNLKEAVIELNNSSDPVISKFIYNPVYRILTSGDEEIVFIQAVAKYFGVNGDWVDLQWSSGIDLRFPSLHETNNPTWNEIKFVDDFKILPKLTHITFTYDKCKIPGKDNPEWTIINNDTGESNDIYFTGRWLTYMFKTPGRYTIELKLEDTNRNKSTVSKNMIIIK